jgi:hypothetical protein
MEIIPLIVIVTIALIIWQSIYLTFFMDISFFLISINISGLLAFIGTALLIRGYILGFSLSVILELSMIIQFSVAVNIVSCYIIALHVVNLVIFAIACMKTCKLS